MNSTTTTIGMSTPYTATGNPRVLRMAFAAFSLGFAIWGMFAALGPFLIKWYGFTAGQALFLAAMPPFFATTVSIPLGIATDRFGGRLTFTVTLAVITIPLLLGLFVESYYSFLCLGLLLGLGGATFVIGNAHVSSWYPKSRQGTALGLFALGNFGISIGMILVPYLIVNVLGGPEGNADMPAKMSFGPFSGWRLIFLIFAIPTILMTVLYWMFTADPPVAKKQTSLKQIAGVYRSGKLVWIVAYLYWTAFGTLTFFSASTPTYLVDRWNVDATQASMVFTSVLVLFVAAMRPVGGWLSDRHDPLKLLSYMFLLAMLISSVLALEISLTAQIIAIYSLALISGASAATVVKLIPTYFTEVGAVSGLAKAAGAACGFTMTVIMALSKDIVGGYTLGFVVWAMMNAVSLHLVVTRKGFPVADAAGTKAPEADVFTKVRVEALGLRNALFSVDYRGHTPLGRVFWIYGVLFSNLLLALLITASDRVAPILMSLLLLGFMVYTLGIMRMVWVNAFNTGKEILSFAARYLTVFWMVNAMLISSYLFMTYSGYWNLLSNLH
jgi:NNP family nitrate/nitrite transporter-like MFS transporter